MRTTKTSKRRHRSKKPLTADRLLRKMQQHPTLTAIILGIVFAVVAAYLAIGMAT